MHLKSAKIPTSVATAAQIAADKGNMNCIRLADGADPMRLPVISTTARSTGTG